MSATTFQNLVEKLPRRMVVIITEKEEQNLEGMFNKHVQYWDDQVSTTLPI